MELVEALKSKKDFSMFVDIWFRETMKMIRKRMDKENNISATFYLLALKNCAMYPIEVPVGCLFDEPNGKDRVAYAIKKICSAQPIIALMFASEAWMAQRAVDQKQEVERIKREGVSNQSDRRECVIVNQETHFWSESSFYELVEDGEKRGIGELIMSSRDMEGRFCGLLFSPKFKN